MQEKVIRWNFIKKALDNPIISKELKGRMRGKQGFLLLTAYLALISLAIVGMYYISISRWDASSIGPNELQKLGKRIFFVVVMFEFLLIVFIGPALTSGAISSEKSATCLNPSALPKSEMPGDPCGIPEASSAGCMRKMLRKNLFITIHSPPNWIH